MQMVFWRWIGFDLTMGVWAFRGLVVRCILRDLGRVRAGYLILILFFVLSGSVKVPGNRNVTTIPNTVVVHTSRVLCHDKVKDEGGRSVQRGGDLDLINLLNT